MTDTQEKILGGVGVGAIAGGACAAAGGSAGLCAGLGVAGAALGWAAVSMIQSARQDRTAEVEYQRYGYEPDRGRVVMIRDVAVKPDHVKPGGKVEIETDYSLMAPPGTPAEPVTQTFSLSKDGEVIHDWDPIDLPQDPGGWVVAQTIPVPEDADPGTYHVKQVLEAGTRSPEIHTSSFIVQ
jgi:hypothetical protein